MNKESQKKVLIVAAYFPPHNGGLERYAFEVATRLQKEHGWYVEVLTSGEKGGEDITEEYEGLTVHRLGYQFKISNTPFSFRWFRKVHSIIDKINPTLVNVHMPVPGMGDIAVRVAESRPVVLTYHAGTMLKNRILPDIGIWLYERCILPRTVAKARKVICSSEFVKKTVPVVNSNLATVITPGVDVEFFKPDTDVKKSKTEIVFVCNFASMHRLKGLYVLVEAVQSLVHKFPDISIKVIGEPGRALGRTRFVGPKKGADLLREIQSGALLALPSLTPAESFGMVLIEAMACKLPVIGSNAGGIPEVIDDGQDGFIVQSGDPVTLANAIENLLSDTDLAHQMGERGYLKVREKFTWEGKVRDTVRVFEQI